MITEDKIITIVGTVMAKEGAEFIYDGPIDACESCKVAKVCHNAKLRVGRRYVVTSVRPTTHSCAVHPGGATAVEVTDADIQMYLPKDMANRRTRFNFEPFCNETNCRFFTLCNPAGVTPGISYLIKETGEISENLPCGRKDLKKTIVSSLPS